MLIVLLALAGFGARAWAAALPKKVGPEFQIPGYTPSVAGLSDGGFVVIFFDSPYFVHAQRFSSAGALAGPRFALGSGECGLSIAGLSGGGFVATYCDLSNEIHAHLYNASGQTVGSDFQVNITRNGAQWPSTAALGDGGFVVTWQSAGEDGDGWGIRGRRYSAAGSPVGADFQVNTYTTNDQQDPSVAALGDGGFVVTWVSDGQDGSGSGVYGQRFSAAGAPAGAEFQVNTSTANNQIIPSVAGLTGGGFVVTWASQEQMFGTYDIYGQRYNAAGTPVGGEWRINTYTPNDQNHQSVAALGNGGFVVTWDSVQQDGQNGLGVHGQRYSATGARLGIEFAVATPGRKTSKHDPSVAGLGGGGFVVIWTGAGQRYAP
jgi:hypothetical protein